MEHITGRNWKCLYVEKEVNPSDINDILAAMFKHGREMILKVLAKTVNRIMKGEEEGDSEWWKIGCTMIKLLKNMFTDWQNWRPIAKFSVYAKLTERVILR